MADLSLFTIEKDCPSSIQPCLNWEKWQLKSNASVYCQCLEPLFTLPTIITHFIWTGNLPVAHQSDAGLGDSLERTWRLLLKVSPVTSVNLALIQMECVHLASWISRPQVGHSDG